MDDAALFIAVQLVLVVIFFVLRGMAAVGYQTDRIESMEALHFWGCFAVLTLLLIDLVVKFYVYVIATHDS